MSIGTKTSTGRMIGMNVRTCKGCIYFALHYGTKNKQGKATVSNYWCIKKQGFIKRFPKECKWKEEQE